MAEFMPAYQYMLGNEDPHGKCELIIDNNGAETIAGINAKSYPNVVHALKGMSHEPRKIGVAGFYRQVYWDDSLGAFHSQRCASKLFDMIVNMEPGVDRHGFEHGQAIKLCQRAMNRFALPYLDEDGVLGPKTVTAVNSAPEDVLLAAMSQTSMDFYKEIAAAHPERNGHCLPEWLRRAEKVPA